MIKFDIDSLKFWLPGASGMVGSALARRLSKESVELVATDRKELDLRHQQAVEYFYQQSKPDVVILSAAKVGGIYANEAYPADFISDNLRIQQNVIDGAYRSGVKKLLFLGSSCIYPKLSPQPIKEEYLLTSALEETNQWYAIAKIAGIKLCQAYRRQHGCDFISVMPTNLYGPNDNFHPKNSHVPAALLSRFHTAKTRNEEEVEVWGTGTPRREFLHVDDLADACVYLIKNYSDELQVNIGTGEDISIADFAEKIKQTVGYQGKIEFDHAKPDGTPRKLLDVSKLHKLGWHHRIGLEQGLNDYYQWFLENINDEK